MSFISWARGGPADRAELYAVLAPLDALATITVADEHHISINGTFTVDELRLLLPPLVTKIDELVARFDAATVADQAQDAAPDAGAGA